MCGNPQMARSTSRVHTCAQPQHGDYLSKSILLNEVILGMQLQPPDCRRTHKVALQKLSK